MIRTLGGLTIDVPSPGAEAGRRYGILAFVPSVAEVEGLAVGDLAVDGFGNESEVVEITYRGTDINGRPFVGFYTRFGTENNGRLSGSYKAGEIVRTVPLCRWWKSAEVDTIESAIRPGIRYWI